MIESPAIGSIDRLTITAADQASGRVAALQMRAAADWGPVVPVSLSEGTESLTCTCLVGREAVSFACGPGRDSFSSAEGWLPLIGRRFGRAVINSDEPAHTRQRRAWAPVFTGGGVERMLRALDACVSRRVCRWAAGTSVDAYECARELAFAIVGSAVAGFPDDARLHALGCLFADVLEGPREAESTAERTQRLVPAREAIECQLDAAIAASRRIAAVDSPGLMAALSRARSGWRDSELREQFSLLLITGHETTASILAWLLVLLAEHPAWQDRIAAEMAAVPGKTIPPLEALETFAPPTPSFPRPRVSMLRYSMRRAGLSATSIT